MPVFACVLWVTWMWVNHTCPHICILRLATTAIKQLPPDIIAEAQNSALWSKDEENILANVPAVWWQFFVVDIFNFLNQIKFNKAWFISLAKLKLHKQSF